MKPLFKTFFGLKKQFRCAKKNSKGFLRNSLFCLGSISAILLVLVSLGLVPLFSSGNTQTKSVLTAAPQVVEVSKEQDLFVESSQNKLETPEFLLVQNNSLQGICPPTTFSPQVLGALAGGYEEDIERAITEHVVESGDNLSSLAIKFNISLNTILWANDLNKNSVLKIGQKLIIPPVTGIIHHVKTGDTVGEIAQKYEAKSVDIISFNGLSNEADVFTGDVLIVPDGELPAQVVQYTTNWTPVANSYFICPIAAPCRITQGLHWYNAIDFSHGKCGEAIYAAAGGTVLKVKLTNSTSKWAYGGAGNHLTILHQNGVVTMYGHIAASLVNPGDQVSQGQMIALMGGQPGTPGSGLSTGCHLHFGVSGSRNPFAQ